MYLSPTSLCRSNGCPWDRCTCGYAAWGGNLDVLKWCRANGCPWNENACMWAASNGHLDVLKWCRENGCPWDDSTCTAAAQEGRLEVLRWSRDNGCPWQPAAFACAARGAHMEVSGGHLAEEFQFRYIDISQRQKFNIVACIGFIVSNELAFPLHPRTPPAERILLSLIHI